jgi:cobyrinic acid a,c-diamide synthase
VAILGCVPKDPALAIPSRHLGLLTAEENPLSEEFLGHLVEVVERHLDLEAVLGFGAGPADGMQAVDGVDAMDSAGMEADLSGGGTSAADRCCGNRGRNAAPTMSDPVRIGVARDAAFCFAYEDNLRLLRESGAELCFFSPLKDGALPDALSGLYLPGGYPELFARTLGENLPLQQGIRAAVEAGMPVYAECGGFIYLTRGVRADDATHPFVGIFPVLTRMLPRRKALGYREVELLQEGVIGAKGTLARGHEFHYSEMEEMPAGVERLYRVSRKGITLGHEGYRCKNCLASYIHLHFGSSPGIADSFVGHCRAYRTGSLT